MIWRRFLVRSDSTIADLHYILQLVMGWTDTHLHTFVIHGKDYGVYHSGGMIFADDPTQVHLRDFQFRVHERFLYTYDFGDNWEHEVRVEKVLPSNSKQKYPSCLGGARACPPEDCGGPAGFLALQDHFHLGYTMHRTVELLQNLARRTFPNSPRQCTNSRAIFRPTTRSFRTMAIGIGTGRKSRRGLWNRPSIKSSANGL